MNESVLLDELRQIRDLLRRKSDRPEVIHVDTAEAARILAVSEKTLGTWVKDGKIPRFVEGGVYRYRIADLEAFSIARAQKENVDGEFE
jgi:excisionase family DNA binding protein